MKIALLLHGQPRNYIKGFEHLNRELISRYDCDRFAHVWWDENRIGKNYETAPWVNDNYQVEEDLIKKLNDLYKFKVLKHSVPKSFIPNKTYNVTQPDKHDIIYNALCSRFYSLKESIQEMQCWQNISGSKYDFVIVTRYDINIFSGLPDLNRLNRNKIYVSTMHSDRKYVFNDIFWIIGAKHINVFKTIFDNLDNIYDRLGNFTIQEKELIGYNEEVLSWNRLNGEEIISTQMIMNGIINDVVKDNRLNYNMIR